MLVSFSRFHKHRESRQMPNRPPITTQVLDLTTGNPVAGMFIVLEHYQDTEHDWQTITETKTDDRGRANAMESPKDIEEGLYRITFDTDAYFGERDIKTFYSSVTINFQVSSADRPYHIPLLLSPYGYSTYRER